MILLSNSNPVEDKVQKAMERAKAEVIAQNDVQKALDNAKVALERINYEVAVATAKKEGKNIVVWIDTDGEKVQNAVHVRISKNVLEKYPSKTILVGKFISGEVYIVPDVVSSQATVILDKINNFNPTIKSQTTLVDRPVTRLSLGFGDNGYMPRTNFYFGGGSCANGNCGPR